MSLTFQAIQKAKDGGDADIDTSDRTKRETGTMGTGQVKDWSEQDELECTAMSPRMGRITAKIANMLAALNFETKDGERCRDVIADNLSCMGFKYLAESNNLTRPTSQFAVWEKAHAKDAFVCHDPKCRVKGACKNTKSSMLRDPPPTRQRVRWAYMRYDEFVWSVMATQKRAGGGTQRNRLQERRSWGAGLFA